jgi:hypothetical protein
MAAVLLCASIAFAGKVDDRYQFAFAGALAGDGSDVAQILSGPLNPGLSEGEAQLCM